MQFRILGPIEVADGDSLIALGGLKQRALLALLLLAPGEVLPVDLLMEELWGEQPPRSGRATLQVLISQLRKALGDGGAVIVVTKPPGYMIRLERDQLDVNIFERLVSEADRVAPAVAADKLREALALWRGPALGDLAYESFAQPAVRRLDELRLVALEKRIDADLALGREMQLVGELQSLVADYPLRERLRGQLMLALYRCGRQADALAVYRQGRTILVEDLGIEPSAPLRELEQAILRQDPSLELAPTAPSERSLLVVALDEAELVALLAVAVPLAKKTRRELVLARLIDQSLELAAETDALYKRREALIAAGTPARAAAFTSNDPGSDAVRMAGELECDLIVVDAPAELLDSPVLRTMMAAAPCDVAALVGPAPTPGPVLVPFVGADHDWTAIELGAWLAAAWETSLRIAGPSLGARDSSRLLASASLAVQHAYGVAAEPVLLVPDAEGLVRASQDAALVIVGLPDRWQHAGLGTARQALATCQGSTALVVRRGLRPGGLAPRESLTRFTWSLRPSQGS